MAITRKSLRWTGGKVTANLRQAQKQGINQTMAAAVTEAKKSHAWQNRTGVLEGGIRIVDFAEEDAAGVAGTWGVLDVEYARIHELGGTILPKKGKFLAIPVSEEAKQAGSPRNMDLSFVQSLKGQPLLVESRNDGMTVHFVLKTSVTIPARPYLRPAADKEYGKLARRIRAALKRLDKGG